MIFVLEAKDEVEEKAEVRCDAQPWWKLGVLLLGYFGNLHLEGSLLRSEHQAKRQGQMTLRENH